MGQRFDCDLNGQRSNFLSRRTLDDAIEQLERRIDEPLRRAAKDRRKVFNEQLIVVRLLLIKRLDRLEGPRRGGSCRAAEQMEISSRPGLSLRRTRFHRIVEIREP